MALARKAMASINPKVLKMDSQLSGEVPIRSWNK
jgi:hypothetical protein